MKAMRKHSMIHRLGALLCVLALATCLWGCNQVTAPETDQLQVQPTQPLGTADCVGDENADNTQPGWW